MNDRQSLIRLSSAILIGTLIALAASSGRLRAADLAHVAPHPSEDADADPLAHPPPVLRSLLHFYGDFYEKRDPAMHGWDYGGVEWTERVDHYGHCPPGVWMFCHDPNAGYGFNVWHEARPQKRAAAGKVFGDD